MQRQSYRQSSPQAASVLLLALLVSIATPAQAGFDALLNPLGLGNPYGMSPNPLAGLGNPLANPFGNPYGNLYGNPYANPLGGLGGGLGLSALSAAPLLLGSPLGRAVPMGAGSLMHPGLQMAPNMMSHSHLNRMTNPYMGGPFGGNPYLQSSLPLPFAPPAFSPGLPGLGAVPAFPTQAYGQQRPYSPFSAPQPTAAQLPSVFGIPFLMPAPPAQPAKAAPAAPQAANPFLFFPAMPAAAGPAPAPQARPLAPAMQPPAAAGGVQTPVLLFPFLVPPAAVTAPAPQAKPATPSSPSAQPPAAAGGVQTPAPLFPFLAPMPPNQPEAAKPAVETLPGKAATPATVVKEGAAKALATVDKAAAPVTQPQAPKAASTPAPSMPLPFDPTPWFGQFFAPPK